MKIEKIKKMGSKYKISLDSGEVIYTYEDVILNNGLLFHKYVNKNLLEKVNKETIYYKSYNKALDMINRRLRSEYELRTYLEKSQIESEFIDEIIDNLQRIGLINDQLYAKAYTNDKINLSLDGPYKIRKHLEENKIKEDYIDEAISNIDKEKINNHIDKIIIRKIKTNTKYTSYMLKQKIIIYLVNLGYSKYDVISRLENFNIESPSTKKEIDKIFNRLNSKYKGKELIIKLKSKMYNKGYTKEEIEYYINKITH